MSDGPPDVFAHPPVGPASDHPPVGTSFDRSPAGGEPSGGSRRWLVVALFGLVSLVVWSVRVVNLWGDLLPTTEEKLWRTGLAATFIVMGLAVTVIGWGLRRWPPTTGDRVAVGILAGWTGGVWASRTIELLGGGHAAAFVVVHLVLAAGSVALAWLAWRAIATPGVPGAGRDVGAVVPAEPGTVGRAGSESMEGRR